MLTLRPYQKEPVRKAIDYFREENPDPSLMVLPTGAGKSVIAAEVAAACPDPILVVQPTKELLEQNLEKYRILCGELAPAGVYSTSFGKHQIDHVTFATIGSIKTIGTQFRQLGFRKMLIDEAHLYPRKEQSMLGAFLRDSGIRQVLGMTATPLKLENFSVKHGEKYDKWSELIMLTNLSPSGTFFKRIIHITQIQELTALGYWSPLRYEVLPFSRDHLQINSTGSEYSDESVITAYQYNNIRANILAALDYHRERRHVLVFVPSVEEAEALASFYPESASVSGSTPKKERKNIVDAFRAGGLRVIFNCNVLATGFGQPPWRNTTRCSAGECASTPTRKTVSSSRREETTSGSGRWRTCGMSGTGNGACSDPGTASSPVSPSSASVQSPRPTWPLLTPQPTPGKPSTSANTRERPTTMSPLRTWLG